MRFAMQETWKFSFCFVVDVITHEFCASSQAFCVLRDYNGLDSFSKKALTLANLAWLFILCDFQVLCVQYLKYLYLIMQLMTMFLGFDFVDVVLIKI